MARPRLKRLAERWSPADDDPLGEDKRRLIRHLLQIGASYATPASIEAILRAGIFTRRYRREQFQHQILGPLRRDDRVFVGTSSKGIFLVLTPEDADATLGFYTWRIRAELRHARNLRKLAKRVKLMEDYRATIPNGKDRATIFIDESGSPNIRDLRPPVFVVAAVVVESKHDLATLDMRFRNACRTVGRSETGELKSVRLSVNAHAKVLHELSLLEYQWAAACFDKSRLRSGGFSRPITFYRYAFQFLVGDLLTAAWQADLVIDQNSTEMMQREFEAYLRRHNSGLPVHRLNEVTFADSSKTRLIQLADLVAGAVRRAAKGEERPLREIEDRMISLQFWPPR